MKEQYFVIKNIDNNTFIGVDKNSGNYPFECKIDKCERFYKIEKAQEYINHFKNKNWQIRLLTVSYQVSGIY